MREFIIREDALKATLNYLGTQKYVEVQQLILVLQSLPENKPAPKEVDVPKPEEANK